MKNALTRFVSLAAAVSLLAACKAESPAITGRQNRPAAPSFVQPKPDPQAFDKTFTFHSSEFTDNQAKYNQNEVTALFTVKDKDGQSVNGLTERDLKVAENGIPIPQFKMGKDEERHDQIADIEFVVDVTGSMGPFIEMAKKRLTNFIVDARKQKYHVRMCLSTFGDFVVKKCDRFYDNDSDDQVAEFISALTSITIHKGQGEYAAEKELDTEENPMRALVEGAGADWKPDSARFMILVTDADFYSPDKPNRLIAKHQARQDASAPTMAQVMSAIQQSQMKVFAVTPSNTPGYDMPLANQKSIADASGGEHFDFQQVNHGQISLDTILKHILHSISTTYKITYVVDTTPGLDPTLPVSKRQVTVQTPAGTATVNPPSSSIPTGRPQYKQTWKVSPDAIQRGSMHVFVSDRQIGANEFSVSGGDVTLKQVPAAGASVRFVFLYDAIEKNLRIEPIPVSGQATARNTKVYLNGKEARAEDLTFSPSADGGTNVNLNPSVMASNDPYDIRANNGVRVRVVENP